MRLPFRTPSLPPRRLRRALWSANLTSTAVALLVASLVLLAYQFVATRDALVRDVDLQARIVGANSAAAIAFDDAQAARETLVALAIVPHIEAATLFTVGRVALADYRRNDAIALGALSRELIASGRRIGWRSFVVLRAIEQGGQVVGYIGIRASLSPLYLQLATYAGLMVLVAAVSLAVTLPLVQRLRRDMVDAEQHLEWLAHVDPVTELPNRHTFNRLLEDAVAESADRGSRIGLALIDLDNFKIVNDTLGHAGGDALLRAIAARLRAALRREDAICRIGGDEFALVLQSLRRPDEALRSAERVLARLADPFDIDGYEIYVTASVGIACCPDDAQTVVMLTRHADTAMYHAKRQGKNACMPFRSEMQERLSDRLALEADLHKAIERGELQLHYQPQLHIQTGRVQGVEALLRWHHPQRGEVPPAEFISIAEDCGLIGTLGLWALQQACVQTLSWRERGFEPTVAVNVSARQFRNERFVDDVLEVLEVTGARAGQIEIEITESLIMESVDSNRRMLERLRAAGVRLSMDDFGTGHSSLAYLSTFPLDQLKIDRRFVERIPGEGTAIALAIIALARSFGLVVVAEGVETREQLECLRDIGCDLVQGWVYAAAMPADELLAWLEHDPVPADFV